MSDIKDYWDNWIVEWENIAYEGGRPKGTVERLASRFRSVKRRMDNSIVMLSPIVAGKTVLDIGCGSGILDRLLIRAGAVEVWGVDFSSSAIQRANQRAADLGLSGKCHYSCANVTEAEFPDVDITVSLGLLDYLRADQITAVFRKTKSPYYLMSFLQRRLSLSMTLHSIYTRHRNVPVVERYGASEIDGFLKEAGKSGYTIDKSASLILKLPSGSH
jgi:2-polyprenyl-3-methyl-5-hydroxy-6-metoxy-1,4-benzoquinol methylase